MKLADLLNPLIGYCTVATSDSKGVSIYEDKTAVPKEISNQEVESWEFREEDLEGSVLFVYLKG